MPEDEKKKEKEAGQETVKSSVELRSSLLVELDRDTWLSLSDEVRKGQIIHVKERYDQLLDEIYNSADLCVDRYQHLAWQHVLWRRLLIVGTGVVAVANLLAAYHSKSEPAWVPAWLWMCLSFRSLLAAVLAAVLAVLANWETLLNAQERAQAYRESRELFLDAAREFLRRWDIYVRPLGYRPEACMNASELYKELIVKDQELRAKFKELTKTRPK